MNTKVDAREYQIQVTADFIVKASDPSQVRRRVANMLRTNGFDEKNFEVEVNLALKKETLNNETKKQGGK